MKIVNFPGAAAKTLSREASFIEVFAYIESVPRGVLVFIDRTECSKNYLENQPWIAGRAQIVEVDQEMVEIFEVEKIPQFIFYLRGDELGRITGAIDIFSFNAFEQELLEKSI